MWLWMVLTKIDAVAVHVTTGGAHLTPRCRRRRGLRSRGTPRRCTSPLQSSGAGCRCGSSSRRGRTCCGGGWVLSGAGVAAARRRMQARTGSGKQARAWRGGSGGGDGRSAAGRLAPQPPAWAWRGGAGARSRVVVSHGAAGRARAVALLRADAVGVAAAAEAAARLQAAAAAWGAGRDWAWGGGLAALAAPLTCVLPGAPARECQRRLGPGQRSAPTHSPWTAPRPSRPPLALPAHACACARARAPRLTDALAGAGAA